MIRPQLCVLLVLACSGVVSANDKKEVVPPLEISGIKLGDKYQDVKHLMPNDEVVSKPHYKGKKYGFIGYSSQKKWEHGLGVQTRPDDTIYEITYYQEFPLKQAESIKAQVCKKYNIAPNNCRWG